MTEYDLAQRERIRQTLLAYMKEHKIGVPRLAARIKETVHRNPEIPVKTLQRFMKGEVRTIDMHVGFLAQFVEKVSKEDPTLRLGFALSAFYSYQGQDRLVGHIRSRGVADRREAGSGDDYRSKIEIVLDQGTWRVKEVADYRRSHDVYDGAMTSSGQYGCYRHEGSASWAAADDYGMRKGSRVILKGLPPPPISRAVDAR